MSDAMSALATYPTSSRGPLVLGHRGACADAPENTVAAFREAFRQDADGVELDAMLCGSGEVVVCHDEWLDRLAGEHVSVSRTPLMALRGLDVGSRHAPRFAGERIPLLAEALAAMPGGAVVNVELKCESFRAGGLSRRIRPILEREAPRLRLIVSSFNPMTLLGLAGTGWPAAVLVGVDQALWPRELAARLFRAAAIHPELALLTAAQVARWREWGLAVAAWTVDAPEDVRRCAALGVDAVITNRPAEARRALAKT